MTVPQLFQFSFQAMALAAMATVVWMAVIVSVYLHIARSYIFTRLIVLCGGLIVGICLGCVVLGYLTTLESATNTERRLGELALTATTRPPGQRVLTVSIHSDHTLSFQGTRFSNTRLTELSDKLDLHERSSLITIQAEESASYDDVLLLLNLLAKLHFTEITFAVGSEE